MQQKFDLKEFTAKAFSDYVGAPFPTWWNKNKTAFVLPKLSNIREALKNGGKSYFMQLKLADSEGNIYEFPNEPLVSLSQKKKIIETPTIGYKRRGTVKEYIYTEDFNVKIRGLCINEDDSKTYPSNQVEILNRAFEVNEALEIINNKFFTFFGIGKLVLKSINYEDMQGHEYIQKYSIDAVSDSDFFAELKEFNNL